MALKLTVAFFSFLILYVVCKSLWMGDQPDARPLPRHRITQTQNKCTKTFMSRIGFDPANLVFEREKIVHTSENTVTVNVIVTV
jgi:hypothetical protein